MRKVVCSLITSLAITVVLTQAQNDVVEPSFIVPIPPQVQPLRQPLPGTHSGTRQPDVFDATANFGNALLNFWSYPLLGAFGGTGK
ncbi:hypothetical protein RRG08_039307 [Elysia crispata]|uniref:Secreted protein n=1 Tax=Elysia crispata TaxID=231223 RepID=A0AAE0Z791_9GAST|nr:hypothetical protein RRG08_039307 [Elysia crispata]